MSHRPARRWRRLTCSLLAAAGLATAAVVASDPGPAQTSASCYYVWTFFPYPHQVLVCGAGNGGGSW